MSKRYASWGSDKTYRWLWRAAIQDGIFAYKCRIRKGNHPEPKVLFDIDKQNMEILKKW